MMSDWLMIVITFIYMVTTIIICLFNYKTIKITVEQNCLDWRIRMLPWLSFKLTNKSDFPDKPVCVKINHSNNSGVFFEKSFFFEVKNIGSGVAKEIRYEFLDENIEINSRYYVVFLPVKETRCFELNIKCAEECFCKDNEVVLDMTIFYRDYFNSTYRQTLKLFMYLEQNEIKIKTSYIEIPSCLKDVYKD